LQSASGFGSQTNVHSAFCQSLGPDGMGKRRVEGKGDFPSLLCKPHCVGADEASGKLVTYSDYVLYWIISETLRLYPYIFNFLLLRSFSAYLHQVNSLTCQSVFRRTRLFLPWLRLCKATKQAGVVARQQQTGVSCLAQSKTACRYC